MRFQDVLLALLLLAFARRAVTATSRDARKVRVKGNATDDFYFAKRRKKPPRLKNRSSTKTTACKGKGKGGRNDFLNSVLTMTDRQDDNLACDNSSKGKGKRKKSLIVTEIGSGKGRAHKEPAPTGKGGDKSQKGTSTNGGKSEKKSSNVFKSSKRKGKGGKENKKSYTQKNSRGTKLMRSGKGSKSSSSKYSFDVDVPSFSPEPTPTPRTLFPTVDLRKYKRSEAPSAAPSTFLQRFYSRSAAPSALSVSDMPSEAPSVPFGFGKFPSPNIMSPSSLPVQNTNSTLVPSISESASPSFQPSNMPTQASEMPSASSRETSVPSAIRSSEPSSLTGSSEPSSAPSTSLNEFLPPSTSPSTVPTASLSTEAPSVVASSFPTMTMVTVAPTVAPSTVATLTAAPSTAAPTTVAPSTAAPSTVAPSTLPSLAPSSKILTPDPTRPPTDVPTVRPTNKPTALPTVAPTPSPTQGSTFAPTPSVAGTRVQATGFTLEYRAGGNAIEPVTQVPSDTALEYLKTYFEEQFSLNIATNMVKFEGRFNGPRGNVGLYQASIVFSDSSRFIPTQTDIDNFLFAAFENIFVAELVSRLQGLPSGDPFAATTAVIYEKESSE